MAEPHTNHRTVKWPTRQDRVPIDVLSDDVLLEIFDFYVFQGRWQTLVHVCQRWRYLVFASPRRLRLQLYCKASRPTRKMLDIWPPLPITVRLHDLDGKVKENILLALEQVDRVCEICVITSGHSLKFLAGSMDVTFPELTLLEILSYNDGALLTIPDSFLGGSAPRLQSLSLTKVSFPALPKLISSTTSLVRLHLQRIPRSGYISPETMVDCLSLMSRLEDLAIQFQSSQCRPDRASQPPPPDTRIVLPVLTTFSFEGVFEYLEDFFAHLDAPVLCRIITKFLTPITFTIPRLSLILGRAEPFEGLVQADISSSANGGLTDVTLSPRKGSTGGKTLVLSFVYKDSVWHLRYLSQSNGSLGDTRELNYRDPPIRGDDVKNASWLELFRFFTRVEVMCLSYEPSFLVASALQELDEERVTEVLPALRNFFTTSIKLSRPVQFEQAIEKFVIARELSGHPVDVEFGLPTQ